MVKYLIPSKMVGIKKVRNMQGFRGKVKRHKIAAVTTNIIYILIAVGGLLFFFKGILH